jgi:aldose 1-epimerase
MSVTKSVYGDIEEEEIYLYTLQHGRLVLQCTTYGATITSLKAPNKNNDLEEVTLCYDSFQRLYEMKGRPYYGCVAGRVANRIKLGKFTLDGREYSLAVNNGVNHLHGGNVGFNQRVWKAIEDIQEDRVGVIFSYLSPDGEEGYPGNLEVRAAAKLCRHVNMINFLFFSRLKLDII